MRYVIFLLELSIFSFEIFHFDQWPFGGAILKKSAIFCISETIHHIVFKLFLHQFQCMEKLQKFQNRCYRVIQIWEKAFFENLRFFKNWPHQINVWKTIWLAIFCYAFHTPCRLLHCDPPQWEVLYWGDIKSKWQISPTEKVANKLDFLHCASDVFYLNFFCTRLYRFQNN